jgi:hypothetical protein
MPQARYARLTGAATHPAGARPSKCIVIIVLSAPNNNAIYLAKEHVWLLINPQLGCFQHLN